jgi:WD40 repeat protein
MKNYAEIWSLAIPPPKEKLLIVSSSEDQTEKIYLADFEKDTFELVESLKGHHLAVTSVDWKMMNERIGEIYVSCSDDRVIRFRDPNDGFRILFEVSTSPIKEWHTLTYLALEPRGHRVAVGSQNGYLFVFDIERRELVFGENVHMEGIEGLDWVGNKICTCSSDLCTRTG